MKLPSRAADLSSAWLSDVLGGPVKSFTVADIGEGIGIFGEISRVTIEPEAGVTTLPATVISKFPTTDPANRPVGDALGIYEREIKFFREIAPVTSLTVPHCYTAQSDPQSGTHVLLLEDLQRYEMGDQVIGATVSRAEKIVDGLVTLHARWWDTEELHALDWLPTSADPAYVAAVPAIYEAGLPILERDWAGRVGADAIALAQRIGAQFDDVLRRTAEAPTTFLHTDTRLDNFFFTESDDPIFIDFQLCVRGRGPADVAYLIGTSMDVELQRTNWQRLLRRYHDGLLAAGVSGYSWERCLHDYRESVLYYTVGPLSLIGTFDSGNERGAAMTEAYTVRMFRHAVECGAEQEL
jgi:Ecdysteroid kinase-like family